MKQFIVAIFFCVAFSALVNAGQRKIAYSRGENIFVADADGTHSKKIAGGGWPEISPDGARIALNTEGDAKNRPGPERHIAIADVASGKVTVLPNIPKRELFPSCLVTRWQSNCLLHNGKAIGRSASSNQTAAIFGF